MPASTATFAMGAVKDNLFYVLGGSSTGPPMYTAVASVWKYNPASSNWGAG